MQPNRADKDCHTDVPLIVRLCTMCGGTLTSAIGLSALVGWLTETPVLATFGAGKIPMAPSTAVFFLLLGAVTSFLRPWGIKVTRVLLATRVPVILLTLTAVFFLFLSTHGIYLSAEHPGFSIIGTVAGAPSGHMSPLTAFCFVLVGLSLLAALHATEKRQLYSVAAVFLAITVHLISAALILAYALGAPLLYDSGTIPPALSTSMAFFLLASALVAAVLSRALPHGKMASLVASRAPLALLTVFVLLATGITTTGLLTFRKHEKQFRIRIGQELKAISALKVSVLEQYRQERIIDAHLFHENAAFAKSVRDYLAQPENGTEREKLVSWLKALRKTHQYDRLRLYDAQGAQRLSIPENLPPASAVISKNVALTLRRGDIFFNDLYMNDSEHRPYQSVLVPIKDKQGQVLGLLAIRSNPAEFLYPFLERWPTPSKSGETQLLRREGVDVLFVSNLRFRPGAALMYRIPLTVRDSPAVQAALGREGLFSGVDYNGMQVLSALKRVPNSPWYLVARVETAEVLAPLRERLWVMVCVLTALLGATGAAGAYVWRWERREQHIAHIQQEAAKDRQRSNQLKQAVAARTADLEAANKELEAFSYTVAHDLKAPLRGIDGYSRLLEKDYQQQLDEDGRLLIAHIKNGVAQMFCLIEDMLDYARMERQTFQRSTIDLRTLIGDIIAEYGQQLHVLQALVQVDMPNAHVVADYEGLAIVLRNLLDNAIKFSSGEGRKPVLDIGGQLEEKSVTCWIKDNGIGFDMKYHDRIFEIFNRIAVSANYPGTGVGLAIAKRATLRMGGRLWADSSPGRGATFFLVLPLSAPARG